MNDFLDTLAANAKKTVESGYYKNLQAAATYPKISLKAAIQNCKANPVITEIKAASPSLGTIRSSKLTSRNCSGNAAGRCSRHLGLD